MRGPLLVIASLLAACGDTTTPTPVDAGADLAAPQDLAPPPDFALTGPSLLSETGLYSDLASRTIAPGILPYEPRWPLWSDGLDKRRWLYLPPGTKIDTTTMDGWVFPVGTKIWKEFAVPAGDGGSGTVVETRLLMKVYDDPNVAPNVLSPKGWYEVAYVWRADGSDAVAAPAGMKDALGTGHDVPSQDDCNFCHGSEKDVPIGVSALQLGAPDGDGTLTKLAQAGRLTTQPAASYAVPGQGTTQAALGYLHGNCGHCHNADAPWAPLVHLDLHLGTWMTDPMQAGAYAAVGRKADHVYEPGDVLYQIVAGHPEQSQLWVRMGTRDSWQMPPLCTQVADTDGGVATVGAWITSLP